MTKHLGFLGPSASELIRAGAPASHSHLHGSFKILYFIVVIIILYSLVGGLFFHTGSQSVALADLELTM